MEEPNKKKEIPYFGGLLWTHTLALKIQLRREIKDEIYDELYKKLYDELYKKLRSELSKELNKDWHLAETEEIDISE